MTPAGSDRLQPEVTGGPAVILVSPQLGQNIGAAARAMLNCGLTDLRLVRPRDGWPNPYAVAAAAGADRVLDAARLYPTTAAAVGDLQRVYATTARGRGMIQQILTPRAAAAEMRERFAAGERVGVLFGPERTGLVNEDLTLAEALITVPLNPAYASLNLAQAVLLVGYEWFQSAADALARRLHTGQTRTATKAELANLFAHLEHELDAGGFFPVPEKRPSMVRNIRNTLQRAGLTEQEVRTAHGIIASLASLRKVRG